MLDRYHQDLEALRTSARRRSLIGRTGLDFASNDYLGLANSPELAKAVGDAVARIALTPNVSQDDVADLIEALVRVHEDDQS